MAYVALLGTGTHARIHGRLYLCNEPLRTRKGKGETEISIDPTCHGGGEGRLYQRFALAGTAARSSSEIASREQAARQMPQP